MVVLAQIDLLGHYHMRKLFCTHKAVYTKEIMATIVINDNNSYFYTVLSFTTIPMQVQYGLNFLFLVNMPRNITTLCEAVSMGKNAF